MILSSPLLYISLLFTLAKAGPANSGLQPERSIATPNDTITFTMSWDFNGDCGKDCYKFIGTGKITAINGKPVGKKCHHLFVKCPSKLHFVKGTTYQFIAAPFKPTDCSTVIDTCMENKFYVLINSIE